MGVIFAFLKIPDKVVAFLERLSAEKAMMAGIG